MFSSSINQQGVLRMKTFDSAAHTPGPWTAYAPTIMKAVAITAGVNRTPIAVASGDYDRATRAANARLIAAAPELLVALRDMLREHDALVMATSGAGDRWSAATRARAVIAKATGSRPDNMA
jgi:hypothetical protein